MKLAIVHDYIKEYGGAERVLEALHEVWPEAPVYTSVYLPEFLGPHKERFKNWDIRTSFLQKFPLKAKLISPFRMLSSFVFESFDLGEFDAVIVSSTGAYISNLLVLPTKTLHFCYCHTPPRYLYGLKTARDYQNNWFMKGITSIMTHFLRQTDFVAAQRPDFFIANSLNTKRRIEKFYRREAEVLYPPVENSKVKSQKSKVQVKSQKSEYYLTGGRLAQAKGTDLVIKTFNKLGLPLKVFGRGFAGFEKELHNIADKNIEFLGEVSDEELSGLYYGAKAFIFTASDEDFGIVPVEAMSYGTPVVALNEGGVRETVIDGKTGVLFDEPTEEMLEEAIEKLRKLEIKNEDCIKQAEKFGKDRFKSEIKKFIEARISGNPL